MSKTGWIILIVCLSLLFCAILGFYLAGRLAGPLSLGQKATKVDAGITKEYKNLKSPYAADGRYTVELDQLKELSVDWISGSVVVELTDESIIRFEETAVKSIPERDALRYGISGGKLRIQACKKNYVGKLPLKNLVLYLPRSLVNDLEECEFDLVSAALHLDGLSLQELEVNTVSGKLDLSNLTAKKAEIDCVSADAVIRDCAFGSLRLDDVSGQMSVHGSIQKVKASSVSGSVQLFLQDSREIQVSTMSGMVALMLDSTPEDAQISTTSADVELVLPKDASCQIRLDSLSGKLYHDKEAVSARELILGDGAGRFSIDSLSGNVWVYANH